MNEIYKITSKTSGKSYIGKTTKGFQKRFNEHKNNAVKGISSHFYNAIRKYGENDFIIEILESNIDINILGDREKFWINFYDTFNSGYNMNEGGGNGYRPHSDETKLKISLAFTNERKQIYSERFSGKGNPMFGNKQSNEQRKNQSNRMKQEGNPMFGLTGELNPNYGKQKPNSFYEKQKITWTEEKRKIHSESKIGNKNGRFGIEVSVETRNKISESNKNSEQLTCPYCGITTNKGNAKRWHFDNCKLR